MSKKCICGRDMVLRDWSDEWVCPRCGRKKPVAEKPSCTVFTCHKCGHVLYVEENCDFPQKLERIAGMSCPECGEQDEGLWKLLGRSDGFAEPIRMEWGKMTMTELIKKLSAELDKETMLLSRKAGKLLLLGSQDSVFLKALAKKADALGIDYELTQCPKGLYQGTIADMETVIDHAAARLYTDTSMDIDNSFHPGMSAVAQAVLTLLLAADLVEGKEITIVGRGHAVQGLAQHLIDLNATVTVAHSKTKSLYKATENRDVVIYATPAITRDISYNTRDLVIDLGNAYPDPDRLSCPYVNRIGQLTTSILLNRFVRNRR